MTNYCFITPVWGEKYLDIFLNISLPTQLASNNLPKIANHQEVAYLIYTCPQDVSRLEASPIIARLAKILRTEIIGASQINFNSSHHYDPFSECYRMGMKKAEREHAAAVFLTADQVWADGSLSHIIGLGDAGYRAVMISGPRVNQEAFIPLFKKDFAQKEVINISSRQAVKMSMDHIHPWDRSLFWDKDNIGRSASFMYWSVPNEGFIMRCFHLHPVFLNPAKRFPRLRQTIDGSDFVRKACPNLNDLHVVQDSDEVMYFSLAPKEQSSEWIDRPKKDLRDTISWARTMGISRHNLYYLKKIVRFHTGEISEKWTEVEKRSDRIVVLLLKVLDKPITLSLMKIYVEFRIQLVSLLKRYPKFHSWSREKKNRIFVIISNVLSILRK